MKINLPCFIHFNDYHEIGYLVESIKPIFPELKGYELPDSFIEKNDLFQYWGFFYTGKKPTKTEIQKLFDKWYKN